MERKKNRSKEGWKAVFTAPDAKVLIVDDNRVSRKMAEGLLRPYHMQVETADSGEQAVEMVRTGMYDLVFMDYLMPGMNGADAVKIIRGMEKEADVRPVIVALSADGDQGVRELLLEAGVDDFLPKPVRRHSIDEILCRWLPEDKIFAVRNKSGNGPVLIENRDLSSWRMDGIDVATGMSYSDNDRELYLEVLTDFADSIGEKADQIERAAKERDLDAYVVGVHSLKSAARYLGAGAVADMAQALETEVKSGDWESIWGETLQLLSSYRKLYQSIAPYRIDRSYTGKKKNLDRKVVIPLLEKLAACMEDYDVDGGEEVVRALKAYDFGEVWTDYMNRVIKAVDQFDYDACKDAAFLLKQALEKES